MSRLIFRLRGVPDDEYQDIQALLDEQGIAWFETDAGNWGLSMPALWVEQDEDYEQARALIEEYGRERRLRLRAAYRQRQAQGEVESLWQILYRRPWQTLGILLFCVFVLYVMIKPFVQLALAPSTG